MAEGGFRQRRVQLSKPERDHGEALPWVRMLRVGRGERQLSCTPNLKGKQESGIENGGLLVGANSGMASGVMGWVVSRHFPVHMLKP